MTNGSTNKNKKIKEVKMLEKDFEKIEELTMLLLYLTSWNGSVK